MLRSDQWSILVFYHLFVIVLFLLLLLYYILSFFHNYLYFISPWIMWQSASAFYHPRGWVCMLMQLCRDHLLLIGFILKGTSWRFYIQLWTLIAFIFWFCFCWYAEDKMLLPWISKFLLTQGVYQLLNEYSWLHNR